MFERFTERARHVIVLAQEEAQTLRHGYIGTEHILLGLLREEESLSAWVLDSLGLTIERVRAEVVRLVGSGEQQASGQIPFTPRAKKVLELALREALNLRHNYIGTEHILLGLIREPDGAAARILLGFDALPDKIRDEVTRRLSATRPSQDAVTVRVEVTTSDLGQPGASSGSELPAVGGIGDAELDQMIDARVREEQALSSRRRILHAQIDILRAERVRRRGAGPARPES